MGSSSGEESGSSPSSSSSSSSTGSGREESNAAGPSADPHEATAAATTSSAPEGEEDSNAGFADPESPNSKADSSSSSEGVLVERPVSSNQDPRYLQGDPDTGILVDFDGSVQEHTEGEEEDDRNRRGEDSSREDMFEDAPDQLAYSEGRRSIGLEESMAMIDIGESNREKQLMDEVARMHDELNGAVAECHRYKEERELMERQLATLRLQLQSMTDGQSQDAGEIELLGQEDKSTAFQSMLMDCTRFASHLQTRFDQQLQSEATIGELHSVIYSKDQEIEELNMKLSEFSMSHDVVASYMGSVRDLQMESAKENSDAIVKKLLDSLANVIPPQEDDSQDPYSQDISLVEKRAGILIEKYGKIIHETKQLGHLLTTVRSGFTVPPNVDELGLVFEETRSELQERKTTELSCLEKLNALEQEKSELLEQLEKVKVSLEESKFQASKAKADQEQAENRLATAKEKLSMAVSKGKSLVQHRDSLKQSLAEKVSELEKCMQELQQKSNALETVEETVEELRRSQELFKEELQQKSVTLQAAEERAEELMKNYELAKQELEQESVALQAAEDSAGELMKSYELARQELDRKSVALQAAEKNAEDLMNNYELVQQELEQKSVALQAAEDNAAELMKNYESVKQELQQKSAALQAAEESADELIEKYKSVMQELERKSATLEAAEKSALELIKNYEFVKQELEQKSIALETVEGGAQELSKSQELVLSLQNTITERENILLKIEDVMSVVNASEEYKGTDIIERVQQLIEALSENRKIQDMLSSIDLPETISSALLKDKINWLTASYAENNRELTRLQDELGNAHSSLESCQSELMESHEEIKKAIESLSVEKQGKNSLQELHDGLVSRYQEIEGKLSEISLQKTELLTMLEEVTESKLDGETVDDILNFTDKCKEKIKERIEYKLESSSLVREEFYNIQTSLFLRTQESSLYERLLEEDMTAREDIKRLSEEMHRASQEIVAVRNERDSLQKEYERIEERSALLREKLSMAVKKGKGLVQERENLKHSLDEKNFEIEQLKEKLKLQELSILECDGKITNLTEELTNAQKLESIILSVKEERNQIESSLLESNHALSKLVQSIEQITLPSDSTFESPIEKLHQIARIIHESEAGKAHAEKELQKLKEKATLLASRLEDSNLTIKSLEEALSEAENRVSILLEEKENAEMSLASVEQELEKLKEETVMQVSKLEHANTEVKLLQDSLSEAENRISLLMNEMSESTSRSKLEIDSLNAKLALCTDEFAGESGNLKNQIADLFNQLRNLESFARDGNVISLMGEGFGNNIGNLRKMIHAFKDIRDQLNSDGLESHYSLKQDDPVSKLLVFPLFEDFVMDESSIPHISLEGSVDNVPSLTKFAEGIGSQMGLLLNRVAYFSSYMTGLTTLMLESVGETKVEIINLVQLKESLQMNLTKLEADYHAQFSLVATIQNDAEVLLSACNDAVETLQIDNDAYSSEKISLSTIPDLGDLDGERNNMTVNVKAAQTLLCEARKTKALIEHLCNTSNTGEREIQILRNKLEEAERIAASASRDKNRNHERADKLETELESLKIICSDLKARIDDYQGKELEWKDKEQELSSLQSQLTKNNRGESWSAIQDQLETLFSEVDRMEIPFKETHIEGTEMRLSTSIDKIFYVVSNVSTLQHVINMLAVEKETLQSDIAAQADEIGRLKTVAESFTIDCQELKRKENDLNDLVINMERIIQKVGGADSLEDLKSADAKSFLLVLERFLLTSIQESENSKSKARELDSRLQVSQMVVNELTKKIEVLECTAQSRPPLVESKDRSIFDASPSITGSEISEIEDSGSLGKKPASSAPAAHVRTLRKGSTDHLALDVDMESERLITSYEAEKGHLFKSLNTSGLIPKQGKLIADRVDSIWVSGGRILMARPRARIGLIAYWLLLHIWVLGSIL